MRGVKSEGVCGCRVACVGRCVYRIQLMICWILYYDGHQVHYMTIHASGTTQACEGRLSFAQ